MVRGLLLAGVPLFDLVRLLGTMVTDDDPAWAWWLVGLALHATVGATWAVAETACCGAASWSG